MHSICLKKPDKIHLVYGDTFVVVKTPEFFDQLYMEVTTETLKELIEMGALKGEKDGP